MGINSATEGKNTMPKVVLKPIPGRLRLSSFVRNASGFQPERGSADLPASLGSFELEADKLFADLPNDLARLVYLASIRDYNTGRYLHPDLSRAYGIEAVDEWLRTYHGRIFERLVGAPVGDYVDQVRLYASFSGTPATDLTRIWKTLEPYKLVVPLGCDLLTAEIFYSNMSAALCILGNLLDRD
jgi:hypothetical protein